MYAFDSRLPASPHVHLARTHPLDPSTWLSALLECDAAPSALLPFATLRNFNRTADHVRLMEAQQPGLPSLLSLPPHRAYLLYYVEAVHGRVPLRLRERGGVAGGGRARGEVRLPHSASDRAVPLADARRRVHLAGEGRVRAEHRSRGTAAASEGAERKGDRPQLRGEGVPGGGR